MICFFMLCLMPATILGGGPFGAPEAVSRAAGGLHTAFGYRFDQVQYENSIEIWMRQNQIYSEAGYGFKKYADIYARLGIADFAIRDVFRSTSSDTIPDKNDFKDRWSFFGTLGVKGFYPVTDFFGVGIFVQGTYFFESFHDDISGVAGGSPFTSELKFKNLWDVCAGGGLQVSIPPGIKIYAGPYGYYSEVKAYPRSRIAGLPFPAGHARMKSTNNWGGYGGLMLPLGKGFQLNVEGQYAERFSAGAAVTYTY